MVAAIKQTVVVGPEGRIEFRAPDVPAGTTAEVILLVPVAAAPRPPAPSQTEALDALQASLKLDPQAAEAWTQQVRADRR